MDIGIHGKVANETEERVEPRWKHRCLWAGIEPPLWQVSSAASLETMTTSMSTGEVLEAVPTGRGEACHNSSGWTEGDEEAFALAHYIFRDDLEKIESIVGVKTVSERSC